MNYFKITSSSIEAINLIIKSFMNNNIKTYFLEFIMLESILSILSRLTLNSHNNLTKLFNLFYKIRKLQFRRVK